MTGITAWLLAAAVAGGHYLYYAWPKGWERSWAQYVGVHILVVVLALLLLPAARRLPRWAGLAIMSCWLAVIESGQAALCGGVGWGSVPESDLCVEAAGVWPYVMASAVLGALFIVGRKRP